MASVTPEPSKTSEFLWVFGFGLALLAAAGWLIYDSYPSLVASTWPSTEGTIKTLKVFSKMRLGNPEPNSYELELTYDYTVNGTTYTGDRFNGRGNHIPVDSLPMVQNLKPGSPCTVYYSSAFPATSILDRTITWHVWVKAGLGLVLVVGGLGLVYLAFAKPKPKDAPAAA